MRLDGGHARQGAVDRLARGVELDVPVRLTPFERRADVTAHASGRFGLGGPDGRQHGQDILPDDSVHGKRAKALHGVALQLLHPVLGHLFAAPARAERFVRGLGGFPESRHLDLTFCGQRIAALACDPAVLVRGLACLGERHPSAAAKPDVVAFAVDRQALDPLFGAARRDSHEKRVAVSVQSRLVDRTDHFDGEPALSNDLPHGTYPTFCTTSGHKM